MQPTCRSTLLGQLAVKAEYTGAYDRAKFQHRIDADGDRCDTRREVLIAESTVKPTVSSSCSVKGKWVSWFDQKTYTDPAEIDIDHMMALPNGFPRQEVHLLKAWVGVEWRSGLTIDSTEKAATQSAIKKHCGSSTSKGKPANA